jgi:hypothetical protein
VKRDAVILKRSEDGKRKLAIDVKNANDIFQFINKNKLGKKYDLICKTVLSGIRNPELYDKEDINLKCENVTAMKFKGSLNTRIYCQEMKQGNKTLVIIASELHESKKNQKNQAKEKNLIKKVARYEYNIIQA